MEDFSATFASAAASFFSLLGSTFSVDWTGGAAGFLFSRLPKRAASGLAAVCGFGWNNDCATGLSYFWNSAARAGGRFAGISLAFVAGFANTSAFFSSSIFYGRILKAVGLPSCFSKLLASLKESRLSTTGEESSCSRLEASWFPSGLVFGSVLDCF